MDWCYVLSKQLYNVYSWKIPPENICKITKLVKFLRTTVRVCEMIAVMLKTNSSSSMLSDIFYKNLSWSQFLAILCQSGAILQAARQSLV